MFSTRKGAARLSLVVIVSLVILKVIVAFLTGSISVTAQAVDSFLDLFAVGITVFAIRMADEPADKEHPFGHGKVEGIAAIIQAILIFTAGGWIIYSAVERIISGTEIEMSEAGIAVMLVSVIASIFLSRHLMKVARSTESLALEASARNINADIYSALGVLVAMILIRITDFTLLDSIVGIGVALLILKTAFDILRKSFSELIDRRLPEDEEDLIISTIDEHTTQLAGYHKVRTRKAGSQRFVDLHLLLPKNMSLEDAHNMADHIEHDIEDRLNGISVTIHLEPCDNECDQCNISDCSLRITMKSRDSID
ncbi:MAG: cation transporter [Dehalococcoidales bacterium]|nr:cation transporter [Dehalococcoidales bacterium]